MTTEIFDDLQAEQDRLDELLAGLPEPAWRSASGAAGWTVADVVLHLAQTEEAVLATTGGAGFPDWQHYYTTVDKAMDATVRAERYRSPEAFHRWRTARRAALAALRRAVSLTRFDGQGR